MTTALTAGEVVLHETMQIYLYPTPEGVLSSLSGGSNRPTVTIGYRSPSDRYTRELEAVVVSVERSGPNDSRWTFVGRTRVAGEIHYFRVQLPDPEVGIKGSFQWLW